LAVAELARVLLSGNITERIAGKAWLEVAYKEGLSDAVYLMGRELINGIEPYERDLDPAWDVLRTAIEGDHLEAIYEWAVLHYRERPRWGDVCRGPVKSLVAFLELSFLFDGCRIAWEAVGEGDYEYALKIYERLADMGSEAAAWNAETLATKIGWNASEWFDLQVKMKHGKALHRLAAKQEKEGDGEESLKTLESAAEKHAGAAFSLAWKLRWRDFAKAKWYFGRTLVLSPKANMIVRFAWLCIYMERFGRGVRDFVEGKESVDAELIVEAVYAWAHAIMIVAGLLCLYILLRVRIRSTIRSMDEN
jgi:TPR repeat protein